MRGIITTLHKHGAMLLPVATPIVYARREEFTDACGSITEKTACFPAYKKILNDTVSEGYARLVDV
jgi:hypothetical protein